MSSEGELRQRAGGEATTASSDGGAANGSAPPATPGKGGATTGVGPFIVKVQEIFDQVAPHLQKAYKIGRNLYDQYGSEHTLNIAGGLFIAFFGGRYPLLIAAFVAYAATGWEGTRDALMSIWTDAKKVYEASRADDEIDADGDGIADVKQISRKELMQRKLMLAFKTVDPKQVSNALMAINAGFMSVLAVLKLKFAAAIALGTSIGDALLPLALKYVEPGLVRLLPKDYKRWSSPIVSYAVKAIAISIAFLVQRIMSIIHSVIKGGKIAGESIVVALNHFGVLSAPPEESFVDEIAGGVVTVLGLMFQYQFGFGSLPFPLWLFFWPLELAEGTLMWLVS